MIVKEIKNGFFGIIANDWDRRLFDELIPLPEGTSYNSYFIRDEKNVLIDTADPVMSSEYLSVIAKLSGGRIDYVISNHSEQDHSGSIPALLSACPEAKVLTSEKGAKQINGLLQVPMERILQVKDGATVSSGKNTFRFIYAPWVHWPETMMTYWVEGRVLFPCDLFGSHMATSRFYASENSQLYRSAKRYFAEIMMPFRTNIRRYLHDIKGLDIELICPSHGPVHDNPAYIMDAYEGWVSDDVKNQVVLPYVSMHGSTKEMVSFLVDSLIEKGVDVQPFNLTVTDIGELATSLVDSATVVIGSPTVLTGPHPYVFNAVYLFKLLRPKTRYASVIGSFGWGGNMLKYIQEMLPSKNIELIEPVISEGFPAEEDFSRLEVLSKTIKSKHHEDGLV